jgi:hypothetical protein
MCFCKGGSGVAILWEHLLSQWEASSVYLLTRYLYSQCKVSAVLLYYCITCTCAVMRGDESVVAIYEKLVLPPSPVLLWTYRYLYSQFCTVHVRTCRYLYLYSQFCTCTEYVLVQCSDFTVGTTCAVQSLRCRSTYLYSTYCTSRSYSTVQVDCTVLYKLLVQLVL